MSVERRHDGRVILTCTSMLSACTVELEVDEATGGLAVTFSNGPTSWGERLSVADTERLARLIEDDRLARLIDAAVAAALKS